VLELFLYATGKALEKKKEPPCRARKKQFATSPATRQGKKREKGSRDGPLCGKAGEKRFPQAGMKRRRFGEKSQAFSLRGGKEGEASCVKREKKRGEEDRSTLPRAKDRKERKKEAADPNTEPKRDKKNVSKEKERRGVSGKGG